MRITLLVYAIYPLIVTSVLCNSFKNHDTKESDPVAITNTGAVKGKLLTVASYDVSAFYGIPFAEPPIGQNRFRKPVAIKPWEGILDATTKSAPCMQITSKNFSWVDQREHSEDCLYLNVWVPRKLCSITSDRTFSNELPILVWIHGGGFWSGSSALEVTDGARLAAYGNVIVASMNYRVGSFGFLYSGTPDAPGNMGLHDQIMAMEWIKNSAKSFGGDPNKVTLFGVSAGSVSVGMHLISPMSRNLFTRAIMQSGSPYHPNLALDPQLIKLKDSQFASALGCANESINLITSASSVVDCLRNLDAQYLVKAESVMLERVPLSFFPIHGDEVLPKSPMEAIDSGDIKAADILIGNNKDEGSIFLNYAMPEVFTPEQAPELPLAQARAIVEALFQQSISPTGKEVADFYLGNVTDGDSKTILKAIYDSFGDFFFVCPSVFFAEKAAKENDVHYYLFTHRPSYTSWGDWVGVGHFEEVPFVFGEPLKLTAPPHSAEECMFSFNMMQKWASFARTGKPVCTANENWPKYSSAEHQFLELNPRSHKTDSGPNLEACNNFWRKHFSQS